MLKKLKTKKFSHDALCSSSFCFLINILHKLEVQLNFVLFKIQFFLRCYKNSIRNLINNLSFHFLCCFFFVFVFVTLPSPHISVPTFQLLLIVFVNLNARIYKFLLFMAVIFSKEDESIVDLTYKYQFHALTSQYIVFIPNVKELLNIQI